MACAYCFYREKEALFAGAPAHRMTEAVLEETMRQLLAQPVPAVSIGWQGGEPTLMGLPFFEKAVDLQTRYGRGKTVGNGLQTNGLLLDRDWAAFLRRYKFLVGLSLDGPEEVHDHYRRLAGGQPTWTQDGGRGQAPPRRGRGGERPDRRQRRDGRTCPGDLRVPPLARPRPHAVHPLRRDRSGAARPGRAVRRVGRGVRPLPRPRSSTSGSADFRDGAPTTFVRFFDSIFYRYVDREPPECDLAETCGTYLVVEHNGDVFACDFFVEPEWRLGNVMERQARPYAQFRAPARIRGAESRRFPRPCRGCEWLDPVPRRLPQGPPARSVRRRAEPFLRRVQELSSPTPTRA